MTEAEWLTSIEPDDMLWFLREKATERKHRLFAVACCRRIWHHLTDDRSRRAVEVAERFADGLETGQVLQEAHLAALHAAVPNGGFSWDAPFAAAEAAIQRQPTPPGAPSIDLGSTVFYFPNTFDWVVAQSAKGHLPLEERKDEPAHQTSLIHCIFGNPFRPNAIDDTWRTPTVVSLAQASYDDRQLPSGQLDPDRLAVLADALEEGGCTDAGILSHLRKPGLHTRGCWVLDALLGKR